jgi:sugar (pentulose or hexulose) kinase
MKRRAAFAGIDLGTTGIRIIVADEQGTVLSVHTQSILDSAVACEDPRASEQDPRFWKEALLDLLPRALATGDEHELRAICVDSTSGTIIPVDARGEPLSHALMHNDVRAQEESEWIKDCTGISAKPSFAISKILWLKNKEPELFEKTHTFVHAADYVKGLISGDFRVTDFSNAVKTGYDLEQYRWPPSIEEKLHIPLGKLPRVVKTGEVFGELLEGFREKLSIQNPVPLVAGATDSTTSFYSSGAERIGDWNTTVGTVLGIRGIAPAFIVDPLGLLYAHRHPAGYWLPGAASNTGGEAVRLFFGDRLEEYDRKIENMPPTGSLIYPLVRKSEKFPFLNMNAQGFINCTLTSPPVLFKGFLEGVAFVERMIYERIEDIGYQVGERIYSMGGGAYSNPWMRLRAEVLGRTVCRAREVEAAFGAAIIAASGVHFKSMTDAQEHMVTIQTVMEPDKKNIRVYEDLYGKFLEECRARGLIA